MLKGKLLNLVFNIFIIFSTFMLVNTIPYVLGQASTADHEAMQKIQELAIRIQQTFDQLPPEQQEIAIPLLQKMMQNVFTESSPQQQELIIQKLNQIFPPQFVEKLLPPGYK